MSDSASRFSFLDLVTREYSCSSWRALSLLKHRIPKQLLKEETENPGLAATENEPVIFIPFNFKTILCAIFI